MAGEIDRAVEAALRDRDHQLANRIQEAMLLLERTAGQIAATNGRLDGITKMTETTAGQITEFLRASSDQSARLAVLEASQRSHGHEVRKLDGRVGEVEKQQRSFLEMIGGVKVRIGIVVAAASLIAATVAAALTNMAMQSLVHPRETPGLAAPKGP